MTSGLSIFNYLLVGLAVAFIVNGAMRYFRGEYGQTFVRFLFSFLIWCLVIVFSLFPRVSHIISGMFGFGDNLNTMIFLGFVVLFVANFKLLAMIERLERNITEIVRKEALETIEERVEVHLPEANESPNGTRR